MPVASWRRGDGATGGREAREVTVGRDKFAPVLDGKSREVGIRHERALDVATQNREKIPVPATRRDERSARPIYKALAERERRVYRRGRIEDALIAYDAQEAREDDVRQANGSSEVVKPFNHAA
jgi:hypothetical protein